MNSKFIASTIYLKNGAAVVSRTDFSSAGDITELVDHFNDCGCDKIYVYDLSEDDKEHEENLLAIKSICRLSELPVCGGGNIKRFEDIKKLIYAGCLQVVVNGAKSASVELCKEGAARFGAEKIIVSIDTMDFYFKSKDEETPFFHEYLIMNPKLVQSISDVSAVPYILFTEEQDIGAFASILQDQNIRGIVGPAFNRLDSDVMETKCLLMEQGIVLDNFEPAFSWDDLKTNEQGLIPVIVQDYKTNQVLMLAYMNREAYYNTIKLGRMTYYSRSRKSLWVKGETSGHYQYVKALATDCDKDTILAKVSQIGAACHTGSYSCFFNDIMKKAYYEKNPIKVLEDTYDVIMDRKINPKEGSYTNYLFDKGIDKILKKVGEEATEIVIAAKNPNPEEIKYEISDFLYHVMVLMAEKGVTWEDICGELSQR